MSGIFLRWEEIFYDLFLHTRVFVLYSDVASICGLISVLRGFLYSVLPITGPSASPLYHRWRFSGNHSLSLQSLGRMNQRLRILVRTIWNLFFLELFMSPMGSVIQLVHLSPSCPCCCHVSFRLICSDVGANTSKGWPRLWWAGFSSDVLWLPLASPYWESELLLRKWQSLPSSVPHWQDVWVKSQADWGTPQLPNWKGLYFRWNRSSVFPPTCCLSLLPTAHPWWSLKSTQTLFSLALLRPPAHFL